MGRENRQEHRRANPLLGILIDRPRSVWRPGPVSRRLYREMAAAGQRQHAEVFYFFAREADRETGQVLGYCRRGNRWRKRRFPLPPVIYNRISERSWENRPVNQAFLKWADRQPGITLLNPRFLNKPEVFQALAPYGELRRFLPLTAAATRENLRSFLRTEQAFFLKPADGCRGQGILYLQKTPGGGWQIQDAVTGRRRTAVEEEVETILARRGLPESGGILQQAVERAAYRGRPFDLRALAQKDGSGRWQYVGAAARIAAKGRILTHVVNGGSRAPLKSVLTAARGLRRRRDEIGEELRWLCETLSILLEKQLPGCWGVLALDLALTPEGKVFLLEVNARPGSFSETAIRLKSLALLLDYCRRLAKGGESA